MSDRASLACLLLAVATALANPWLQNRLWRNITAGLAFASAVFFVVGGSTMTHPTGRNVCAMSQACEGKPADHGMMCADHRAEDQEIERMFSDDVQPDHREPAPKEQTDDR